MTDAGLMGKASIDWDHLDATDSTGELGSLIQPCPTTGIPCECGGGRNIRSRGEAHRPVRVSWYRGAGASMAAGEADRRAGAVGVEERSAVKCPLMS